MLERAQTENHAWGAMTWLVEGAANNLSLARMVLLAGETSPAHRHGNCDEAVHVLSGRIKQRCNQEWVVMAPGDTIVIKRGDVHQTQNLSLEEACLMICYSSGERHYEQVED